MEEPKPKDSKTWVAVMLAVALIGCVGTSVAAFIGIVPDLIRPSQSLETPPTVIVTSASPPNNSNVPPLSVEPTLASDDKPSTSNIDLNLYFAASISYALLLATYVYMYGVLMQAKGVIGFVGLSLYAGLSFYYLAYIVFNAGSLKVLNIKIPQPEALILSTSLVIALGWAIWSQSRPKKNESDRYTYQQEEENKKNAFDLILVSLFLNIYVIPPVISILRAGWSGIPLFTNVPTTTTLTIVIYLLITIVPSIWLKRRND